MLFDQHRVSTVKPGIKPGESKIKSMLKGNNINFNKCVDTYATKGYKPGGFNNIVASHNDKKPYSAEISDNYEFGWHTSFFDNAMTLNGAVYYIRSKDKQIYVGPVGMQSIRNAGKAESKGIELSSQIKPMQGLRLSLGGNIGKSNFTNATDTSYKGKRLPYAPDVMLNASFDYLIDQTWLPGHLYLNAGTRYYSKSYFNEANTLEQGGYTLYDASLSLEMAHGINVKLYGENLGNKQYRVFSFPLDSVVMRNFVQ
ncbi:TonB-dependent receptor domain-containing protein [Xenorhabdus kozodoii]|uniref:Pesticin/yersiniabactin receptor n=1 Tax=Xenorhabdus kozodoii TaxID=351676 RepID=A0A2D0KQZ6_9GAMM|nr:TonB-dependent receptor [Xenorhabdus kozodoii]PHM65846.1 pesticin/yersiniabactin receptor [Xenorhabdus kozodoii]